MYLYKEFIKELNASKSDYIEDFSDLYIAEISNKLKRNNQLKKFNIYNYVFI